MFKGKEQIEISKCIYDSLYEISKKLDIIILISKKNLIKKEKKDV